MIYFKAEANLNVGGGHLQRSLALANKLRKHNVQSRFIFSESSESVIEKVNNQGFEIIHLKYEDRLNPESYLNFLPSKSIIVFDTDDSRFYSGHLIDQLRFNSIHTVCFTISDSKHISTDVLINPNIIARIQKYKTPEYTKRLLGPKYMIFREEFYELDTRDLEKNDLSNILIVFGNADINHLTLFFVDTIKIIQNRFAKINIVAGPLNPDIELLSARVRDLDSQKVKLHIDVKNIIELYRDTSLAITAAGMAMWEMALFNIPQMVVASSDREIEYVNYLSELNYIFELGTYREMPSIENTASKIEQLIYDKHILKDLKLHDFRSQINPTGIENILRCLLELL